MGALHLGGYIAGPVTPHGADELLLTNMACGYTRGGGYIKGT